MYDYSSEIQMERNDGTVVIDKRDFNAQSIDKLYFYMYESNIVVTVLDHICNLNDLKL